ncbi:MAG TPA: hypothetical protein PKW33_07250 [Anaerolineaceae bacterium]|nr:hypothetical protein [Anaerolineaceae bacterium]HPN51367.1 hypothetical protein [Anaerolineaceae bacterium]
MPRAYRPYERTPLLTEDGRRLLQQLEEHPNKPQFNDHCGDFLTAAGLDQVRAFQRRLLGAAGGWLPGEKPAWLEAYAAELADKVPFFRSRASQPARFEDLPFTSRADLSRAPEAFVPDDLPLDDLIRFNTSGATGHPLTVVSHPVVASLHLPLIQTALEWRGARMQGGPGRVAMAMVCFQKTTITCASISAVLDQAGFVKVNLDPGDWKHPDDRARFLDACAPEVYSGDPLSFAELMRLPLTQRPKALISTSMALQPGFHQALEAHFNCPVIDLYSLNETGPVAAGVPGRQMILPHQLYVEIIDPQGNPCPPGVRGEVTLTGGFNPYVPLLRYRTGDWASLDFQGRQPLLVDLEGRLPVVFYTPQGQAVNNIDVTILLKPYALAQFNLHQAADGRLTLTYLPAGPVDEARLRHSLEILFGPQQALTIQQRAAPLDGGSKQLQYTTEMPL